jgi:hypothetical protein
MPWQMLQRTLRDEERTRDISRDYLIERLAMNQD